MSIYLKGNMNDKNLEIASKFAWDNKMNITIYYNQYRYQDYIIVNEVDSVENINCFSIDTKLFDTYNNFWNYIKIIKDKIYGQKM